MTKQSYFVITRRGRYSSDEEVLWFDNLDKALEVFRLLVDGATVNMASKDVPKIKQKKDDYVGSEYLHYIKAEADYKIENRHVDIYTLDEIKKIEKERKEVNNE